MFSEMGFKIYRKSPYEYLAEMVSELNLGKNVQNTISSYIDFALTLVGLAEYDAQEIFAGTLVAFGKSYHVQEIKISNAIEEIAKGCENGEIVGRMIYKKWEELLE
jgi:hypothetical protein